MRAKRSAEGKQAAHRYRAEAFESAFRDEEKLLNPIRSSRFDSECSETR
ncbi:hypothetical protein GCWU000341_01514 [Oribacterium sp. oral taxon 078 str. F0262]|nr:hypothetical protein GCWU000341_01514 [Oribacterium sp. oral taxon 078 str. F0262]